MTRVNSKRLLIFLAILVLTAFAVPQLTHAKIWQATAGAQSNNLGRQALAFLPNEVWIHEGDSITWAFPTEEIHTVTFLTQNTIPQQIRRLVQAFPEGAVQGRRLMAPISTVPRA